MALGRGLGSLIPSQNNVSPQPANIPVGIPQKKEMRVDSPPVSQNTGTNSFAENSSISKNDVVRTNLISRDTQSKKNDDESKNIFASMLIPIELVRANESQPRKKFAEEPLRQLANSLKQYGIIQPLLVSKNDDRRTYTLIAGERRFRAAQLAGLKEVPCVVRRGSAQEKFELALIENIQREDLNPIEEALAYERLMKEFSLTQQEIADRVGKNRSTIANAVRLLLLPGPIQEALIEKKISMGKARALLSLKNESEQMALFNEMLGREISVRDVENKIALRKPRSRRGVARRDPNIIAQEQMLEEALNTKVKLTQKGGRGLVSIYYYSIEELRDLFSRLTKKD